MSYHRQIEFSSRKKRRLSTSLFVVGGLIGTLFLINHFTFGAVSGALHFVGAPLWKSQSSVINTFENIIVGFKDKQSLKSENDVLREEIVRLEITSIWTEILSQENEDLRGLLNRENSQELVAATILARPNRTLYDTFVVDVGRRDGVSKGARVFGIGGVSIGSVEEVYARTTLISLYSAPGRSTEVLLEDKEGDFVAANAIGRGGGNFEIRIPRGIEVLEGYAISSPEFDGGIFGVVEEVIALPADSFQMILFSSPVSIQALRIVSIQLQ